MPRYRIAIDLADLVDLRERHVTSLAWEDEVVRIRTDGQRLVVFTYSGKQGMREAYAYTVDGERVAPAAVRVLSMGRLPRAAPARRGERR